MKTRKFASANREAWDEATPLHRSISQERLLREFSEPGFSCLDEVEVIRLKN